MCDDLCGKQGPLGGAPAGEGQAALPAVHPELGETGICLARANAAQLWGNQTPCLDVTLSPDPNQQGETHAG